jgi:hypothetical protein
MNSVNQKLDKVLVLILALLIGCTSVTSVPLAKLEDREQERMTEMPGLRVYGYVPRDGEKQEIDAFIRLEGEAAYFLQPVGEHASVPGFSIAGTELEALLLERVDEGKTLAASVGVITLAPVVIALAILTDLRFKWSE